MALKPEEVTSIIKTELEQYESELHLESVGSVLQVGDGIARVYGLDDVMAGELVSFPGNVMGMVLNLEEDNVGTILFGATNNIKEGDVVKRTGKIAQIPVGDAMVGRVVDALGRPIDGKDRSSPINPGRSKAARRTWFSASRCMSRFKPD